MPYNEVLKKIEASGMKEEEKIDFAYRLGQMEAASAVCILLTTKTEQELYNLVEKLTKEKRRQAYEIALREMYDKLEKEGL